MRMSTRPSSLTTPSTRARPCSGRDTSPARALALPPAVLIAILPVSFAMRLLSPCPDGLFEMIHTGRAAVAHHLPHLIDHGSSGGVNEAAQDGQLYHRPIALRNADEARDVRPIQRFERHEVHARDLCRIRGQR